MTHKIRDVDDAGIELFLINTLKRYPNGIPISDVKARAKLFGLPWRRVREVKRRLPIAYIGGRNSPDGWRLDLDAYRSVYTYVYPTPPRRSPQTLSETN